MREKEFALASIFWTAHGNARTINLLLCHPQSVPEVLAVQSRQP
ncbi:MAG TPA: hypothetical protein VKD72_05760 [Gemmataceae bacterium]|nr:hypothetical protein [Gemmataceae bacterium]